MTLAFGAVSFPVSRERGDAVPFLELLLAGGIAGTFGLLLTLVWTAGFVPTFLEPSAASVLLAKPVARWQLLLGKYFGVLTFVGVPGGALRRLDVARPGCAHQCLEHDLLVVHSPAVAPVRDLLQLLGPARRDHPQHGGVRLRLGALLASGLGNQLWLRDGSRRAGAPSTCPPGTLALAEAAYWISPKPIDAGLILFNALDADHHFEKPLVFKLLESAPRFSPHLSILSSLVLTCVLLALSTHEFNTRDY